MLPVFISNRIDEFVFIGASSIWFLSEMLLTRNRRPASSDRVQDRFSGLLLAISIWLGIFAAWLAAFVARQFSMGFPRMPVFCLGILLMLAGLLFRWYSIRVLGRYFTVLVAVRPGHTIVEAGPYRFLRHPSYSGSLLTLLGFGLAFTNWLSLALAVILPVIGYSYRMAVEEQALVKALGDTYREYMKRTRRIIPFVI